MLLSYIEKIVGSSPIAPTQGDLASISRRHLERKNFFKILLSPPWLANLPVSKWFLNQHKKDTMETRRKDNQEAFITNDDFAALAEEPFNGIMI